MTENGTATEIVEAVLINGLEDDSACSYAPLRLCATRGRKRLAQSRKAPKVGQDLMAANPR